MIDALTVTLTVILSIPVMLLTGVSIYLYVDRKRLKDAVTENTETQVLNRQFSEQLRDSILNIRELEEELSEEREKNRTLLSQKKSSETRLGQISEHLVPFLENCRHDPKSLHFMGNPIDYIAFNFDEASITFIEVKSGNSKPSKRQKIIKNIIKTGRIFYDEIRINERGVKNRTVGSDEPKTDQSKKPSRQNKKSKVESK